MCIHKTNFEVDYSSGQHNALDLSVLDTSANTTLTLVLYFYQNNSIPEARRPLVVRCSGCNHVNELHFV